LVFVFPALSSFFSFAALTDNLIDSDGLLASGNNTSFALNINSTDGILAMVLRATVDIALEPAAVPWPITYALCLTGLSKVSIMIVPACAEVAERIRAAKATAAVSLWMRGIIGLPLRIRCEKLGTEKREVWYSQQGYRAGNAEPRQKNGSPVAPRVRGVRWPRLATKQRWSMAVVDPPDRAEAGAGTRMHDSRKTLGHGTYLPA
jgi:hypothetical protein